MAPGLPFVEKNYEVAKLTADQMIVNESDSIRISCEARGSPPLIITWQSSNNIVISENTLIHSQIGHGT